MVSLVIRKSLKAMLGYFGDTFDSMMWVAEAGERMTHPRVGGLIPGSKAVEPWSTLSPEEFVALARAVDDRRTKGGVLAIELGFAPPKSVSIAALACLRVSREIIAMHRSAVDDALSFMSLLLVAREKERLTECGVRLMEFLHPWNRATEPQLHSHVLVIRDFHFSHALWTTPLFLVQRTLRAVYHYSLCARLLAADHRIRLGDEGTLAWELDGVPTKAVEKFSERSKSLKAMALASPRGYFSQGAEFQVAGLASRRHLPKTDPTVSLGKIRETWRKKLSPFHLLGHSPRMEAVEIDLPIVFRMSSVLTREQFVGEHLRWWLGARAPLPEAVLTAERLLNTQVGAGRILTVGRGYCYPKSFESEDALIREITSGFDGDEPLYHTQLKPSQRVEKAILAQSHSVKVVSTAGEPVLDKGGLRTAAGKPFKGQVVNLRYWDCAEVLEKVRARQGRPLLVTIEEPFSVGDFGYRLVRLQLTGRLTIAEPEKAINIAGRTAVVTGRNTHAVRRKSFFSGILKLLGPKDDKAKKVVETEVTLAPDNTPEELGEMNWNRLKSSKEGTEVEILRPVPWETLTRGEWKNLGVFAFRSTVLPVPKKSPKLLRTVQKKAAWFLTGPPVEGVIPVIGKAREKGVRVEALQAMLTVSEPTISVIERVRARLAQGIPVLSPIRFESKHQSFPAGEVRIFDRVDPDGKVWFRDGQYWPNAHLVMEPAFLKTRIRGGFGVVVPTPKKAEAAYFLPFRASS
jgi:conjugative relaxase-like TrwC/TraI family protein